MNHPTTSLAKKSLSALLAAAVIALAMAGASPAGEQQRIGTVKIRSIEQQHNVYSEGKKGMRINVEMEAHQLKGRKLSAAAFFHFENGPALKDFDQKYRSSQGNVATWKYLTPRYDRTRITLKLFLPYEQLHVTSNGKHKLQFYVGVDEAIAGEASANWPRLARSKNKSFTYSRGADAEQTPLAPQIADSRWQGRETLQGYGKLTFRLDADGAATMVDATGSHKGTWRQNGRNVDLTFFSGDVVYSGAIDGNSIRGFAGNGGGTRWVFEVERQ